MNLEHVSRQAGDLAGFGNARHRALTHGNGFSFGITFAADFEVVFGYQGQCGKWGVLPDMKQMCSDDHSLQVFLSTARFCQTRYLDPMPTNLEIEIFVDDPSSGGFADAAKTVFPLLAFLKKLDGTKVPEEYFSVGSSTGMPQQFPLRQQITVYNSDQARAIGYILKGWASLNIQKRVVISSGNKSKEITHETGDIEEEMVRLVS